MAVNGIEGVMGGVLSEAGKAEGLKPAAPASFKEIIADYLKETNQTQIDAGEAIEKLARGEVEDIHDVMITMEKSRLSLELIMEIRNKLLDAYRELMRMQV